MWKLGRLYFSYSRFSWLLGVVVCFQSGALLAFNIGDKVQTTTNVNVRQTPAGTKLGRQNQRNIGRVIGGPTLANLNGVSYTWLKVNFSSGPSGWIADSNLGLCPANIESMNEPIIPILIANSDAAHPSQFPKESPRIAPTSQPKATSQTPLTAASGDSVKYRKVPPGSHYTLNISDVIDFVFVTIIFLLIHYRKAIITRLREKRPKYEPIYCRKCDRKMRRGRWETYGSIPGGAGHYVYDAKCPHCKGWFGAYSK